MFALGAAVDAQDPECPRARTERVWLPPPVDEVLYTDALPLSGGLEAKDGEDGEGVPTKDFLFLTGDNLNIAALCEEWADGR